MKRSIIRNLLGRGRLFVYLGSLLAVGSALGVGQARADDPDSTLNPTFGSVTLKAGFTPDPFSKSLVAGGPNKIKRGPLTMHVGKAPDFKLYYTAGKHQLRIYVESKGDTTLLIRLPNGSWVGSDDSPGPNPTDARFTFAKPQSGRYDIWVGTFGPKEFRATLKISELAPDKVSPKPATRLIVCEPVDWVQVNLDAGLGWFGRDVPGIREAPETKDSLTAMLKKHGFDTQYRGVKGTGNSVKLQLFARLTKETRTPATTVTERADREVKAIADMVYGGQKAVGKKVFLSK